VCRTLRSEDVRSAAVFGMALWCYSGAGKLYSLVPAIVLESSVSSSGGGLFGRSVTFGSGALFFVSKICHCRILGSHVYGRVKKIAPTSPANGSRILVVGELPG